MNGDMNIKSYHVNGVKKTSHVHDDHKNDDDDDDSLMNYPKKQSRGNNSIKVQSTVSYTREDVIKWYGWGYKDSYFHFKNGNIRFTGNRYPICNKDLPYYKAWVKENYDIVLPEYLDIEQTLREMPADLPDTRITDEQLRNLKRLGLQFSLKSNDRLLRSIGQSTQSIFTYKNSKFNRIVDVVLWPTCHEDVVEVVKICDRLNIVLIPFGGGTSVSGAIQCPQDEPRTILSLDTSFMNEILWIDEESMVVCCESGIIGQDLERELRKLGYTVGHEPDSIEFSTLGGWVATRASGMKKNEYGNIEDIMVHCRMVTPRGVLEKGNRTPRMSCGPEFDSMVLGSEGCLGVITEVVIKIRPVPPFKLYGSLVFPDFESGFNFLREVTLQRYQPASLRLMDNEQFQLGQAFRIPTTFSPLSDAVKMFYLSKVKGYDLKMISAATLLYVGEKVDVLNNERKINAIAAKYGGIPGGSKNGEKGYNLTFVIAYIRDVAMELDIFAESVEFSVPWDRALKTVQCIKQVIAKECKKMGIVRYNTMYRIAQVYDAGCCFYFYFIFKARGFDNVPELCTHLEKLAKDEVVNMGGSPSHHHGIGKERKHWYEKTVSPVGHNLLRVCKSHLDPNNIFAVNNLSEDLQIKKLQL